MRKITHYLLGKSINQGTTKTSRKQFQKFSAKKKKRVEKNHNISPTSMGRRLFSRLLLLAPTTKCSYPDSTSLDFFFTLKLTRVAAKIQNAARQNDGQSGQKKRTQ